MSKKHNLFVSFSTADNTSESNFGGWVDNFIRYLTVYIQRINNESPDIIPLAGDAKRPSSLDESDGIIIIASKNYINEGLNKKDESLFTDTSRIYKIDVDSIKRTSQPKDIRTLNSFNFFESSLGSDEIIRLSAQSGSQTFWLKIIDLAFEINRTMYQKKSRSSDESRKTIYLAETSYDQVNNRDEIKRELIRHGHIVLPSTPFSSDLKELENQIIQCLEKADLSVHIIGESYGEIPEGSDKSIVEIQNQLSTEHYSKKKGSDIDYLHRLIWMPLNLKARSDQQKIYLDQLKDDIVSTAGAEIIQTPLEILKTVIHSRLQIFDTETRIRKMKESSRSDKKSVYVLFDKKDESEMSSMIQDIKARNIEVILPKFDGKQIEFLESHRNSLIKSDAVLLFANKNLNWLNSKLNDVIKAPGFGKQFPFDAKAIMIKDSSIPKEKIANFGDLILLNGENKDKKTDLGPFLDKIASS